MPNLYLGTSSWNFTDWKGVFYPQSISNAKLLSFYAGQFPTVEVNTSFYALPKPTTLVNWVESVPPGFTFALKAPRLITHEKRLVDCRAETLAYLDALRSLGPVAAPALLQLPPSLTRAQDGRALAHYITWLADELGEIRLAVEVRSPDLMTPAFAKFLVEHGLSLVLVDREGTPDLFPIWAELVEAGIAPAFCLIRWIGDDKNGPSGNQALTNPRDDALDEWASRMIHLGQAGIDVYGYMHNPYEGHSPASVRRLTERVNERLARLNTQVAECTNEGGAEQVQLEEWPPEGWSGLEDESDQGNQLSLFGDE